MNEIENKINKHLNGLNLDLRKTKYSRFMDQKVTPDVLCFIADCIMNLPNNSEFITKDIWESSYFEKNVIAIFGKPSPKNENAKNEYDKFIIQPLRMLHYAGVLNSKKIGSKYVYSLNKYEILEFISIKERNAYLFLFYYLTKVLSDSGLLLHFESFKNKCKDGSLKKNDFENLKTKFVNFMRGNTPINKELEIRRIFPKVLNIYSVYHSINGAEKGSLSKHIFNFSDLMYNRENWRDIGKSKKLTRTESQEIKKIISQKKIYHAYIISKAKDIIRKKYKESEVHDSFSRGTASHIHHIFPISEYPQLATFLENLIKLTATQHLEKAHPRGNTQIINRDYQCVCLIAKSQSIEESINRGELIYTKPNFIYVVNTGLNLNLDKSINFEKIRDQINEIYNEA